MALKEALAKAFKAWLDESRAQIVRVIIASLSLPAAKPKQAEAKEDGERKRFTPNELAKKWNFHVESVRRMLRLGKLPVLHLGRRVLVPAAAVTKYEVDATNQRGT